MKTPTKQRKPALQSAVAVIDDSLFMEGWTMDSALQRIKTIRAQFPPSSPLRGALYNAGFQIEVPRDKHIQAFEQFAFDEKRKFELTRDAMERAFSAGILFASILARLELPVGKGKAEHPAWPFIRRAWKESGGKLNHKEAVDAGVKEYRKATGDDRKVNETSLVSGFKRMVRQ